MVMKIIKLKSDALELEILPELGGSIKNLNFISQSTVRAIFRDAKEPNNVGETSYFPLVPFSNRIKGGQFLWQQQKIELPLNFLPEQHAIHGFGWQNPWQVEEQLASKAVLTYENTCPNWPFHFRAKQVISLLDNTLVIQLQVVNLSDKEMPCGLGFHPYFTKTPQVRVQTGTNKMWAVDSECLPTEVVKVPFEAEASSSFVINDYELDNALFWPKSQATIEWPEWKLKARLSSSNNCSFLVCYSPSKENFFCLEPVTHCTDAFNKFNAGAQDTGVEVLAPNSELTIHMELQII